MTRGFRASDRREGALWVTRGGLRGMGLGEESRSGVWEMLSVRSLLGIQERTCPLLAKNISYTLVFGRGPGLPDTVVGGRDKEVTQALSEMSIRCPCCVFYISVCPHMCLCKKRYS